MLHILPHEKNHVCNSIDVVVHRHADDAMLEIFLQNFEFFLHHVLDFAEEIQRDVPWETLDTDWFSINPVQLTIKKRKISTQFCPSKILQTVDSLQFRLQDAALKRRIILAATT